MGSFFANGRTNTVPSWVEVDLMSLVMNDKLRMRLEGRRMVSHTFLRKHAVACWVGIWGGTETKV